MKGAVKQQKMELVPQSVSSSSPAPAQGRAATPWHCQVRLPGLGMAGGWICHQASSQPVWSQTLAPQTRFQPAGERATHLILLAPFHPERVRLSRQPRQPMAAAFPDHSTGDECIWGNPRLPCATHGTARSKLPSRAQRWVPRMPKPKYPAEAGPGLLGQSRLLSHWPAGNSQGPSSAQSATQQA